MTKLRKSFRRLLAFGAISAASLFLLTQASVSFAADWPPKDPNEPLAKVAFTEKTIAALRKAQSFAELQNAVGAHGRVAKFDRESEFPYALFTWQGAGNSGHMEAALYETGDFGVTVTLAGAGHEIRLNNFGAFDCPSCKPAAFSCGHRPSWVPHDLHWDTFDCGCTMTGPMSLRAGRCASE